LTVILNSEDRSPRSSVIYPDVRDTTSSQTFVWPTVQFSRSDRRAHRGLWLFRSGPQQGSAAEKPASGRSLKTQQHVWRRSAFHPSSVDMLEALAGQEADGRVPV
jgi:hypothetical protein